MTEVLYYGRRHDSQRVIDVAEAALGMDVGYRFVPASRREDGRAVWGVRVDAESVDESVLTAALNNEFGDVELASVQ
jgi:hypothetical protein